MSEETPAPAEANAKIEFMILKSGDKLIGETTKMGDVIHITRPLKLLIYNDPMTGGVGFSFNDYLPKQLIEVVTLTINVSDTICVLPPSKFLEECYLRLIERDKAEESGETLTEDEDDPGSDPDFVEENVDELQELFESSKKSQEMKSNPIEGARKLDKTMVDYILKNMPRPKYIN